MKVALISGASGGIGAALVKKFINNGFFVAGQYNRSENEILKIRQELAKDNLADYFYAFRCDFTDKESVIKALENIGRNYNHIDVLVNNAGMDYMGLLTETEYGEWKKIFAVNVDSVYALSKFALKSMHDKGKGKIINVSSIWGIAGAANETAYSATKAAIIGFTKALAKETAYDNITVNCVCPGVIDTEMNACFNESEMADIIERTPLKRLGTPEEIAELIYFLASDKADFITGQVITADGGFIL